MSQPLRPLSPASQSELDSLRDEIAFQKVLLNSIDDSVHNREAAEEEIRNEIKTLEKQVQVIRRATRRGDTTASQSPSRTSTQLAEAASQRPSLHTSLSSHTPTTRSGTSAEAVMEGYTGQYQHSSAASTVSPSSANIVDYLSPSKMTLPSRKRSHSQHLDGSLAPLEDSKSRRTTPGPPTPSTISSGDDEFEAFSRNFFMQHKAEEDRIARIKDDENIARRLQTESHEVSTISGNPASTTSAFDRLSGIRPQPPALSTQSPPKIGHVSNKKAAMSSMADGSGPSRQGPTTSRVKTESMSSEHIPGAYRDDYSSASDTDLEVIDASAFRENRRVPRTPATSASVNGYGAHQRPIFSPEAQTAAIYGQTGCPSWQSGGSASQDGIMMSNAQRSGYPSPSVYGNSAAHGNGRQGSHGYADASTFIPNNDRTAGTSGMSESFASPFGDVLGGMGGPSNAIPLDDLLADRDRDGLQSFYGLGDRMHDQLDYLLEDPRKTARDIKDLLENIRPDEDLPKENREGTPDGLVYPLYEHQKLALTWLKKMEDGKNKGGILADDMGLGKTISSLALMLSRPSEDRHRKTTLIVGPVALVRQWAREIEKKVKPSHRFSTHLYHGSSKKLSWEDLRTNDVVLTTYGTLGAEFRRLEMWLLKKKQDGDWPDYDQKPMLKLFPLLGPKSRFYRIFLDEAQCIKNRATNSAKAACSLKSNYKWCLTGTPMMNNVGELYSLIHFIGIKPYNDWKRFSTEFGVLTKGNKPRGDIKTAMKKLQALLKAILLRRVKTSLIDGEPIVKLPPKIEETQHVIFDEEQKAFYHALESKTQIIVNRYIKAGTVGKHYSNVLVLLLRLRQACCHPHLIQDFEEAPGIDGGVDLDTMLALAKSLAPGVIERILAAEDAFECPVCYDAVTNPRIVTPCGHDTCSECLSKISDQNAAENVLHGNDGGPSARCPTCRGVLDIKKVIDYSAFKKAHKPDSMQEAEAVESASDNSDSDSEDSSDAESEVEGDEEEVNSDGDLRDFIVPDDIEDTISEADGDDEADAPLVEAKVKSKDSKKMKKSKSKRSRKSKGKQKEKPHMSLAVLKKEAMRNAAGRKRYMKYLRKNWQPSAKVTKCVELLGSFLADGKKTIVFSQFVSLLDLLQVPIDDRKWKCLRYDGSMSADSRNDAINRFTDSSTHNIMLISLKAGNAGLNLVAASRVIILDPFWNPYIEMQAVDRAYRIGQNNPVEVHRILVEGTVEDRIIELQEQKRKLVDSALDEGANKSIGRLDVRQLAYLFGVQH